MPPFEEVGDCYFLHVGPSVHPSTVVAVKLLPIYNWRILGATFLKFDRQCSWPQFIANQRSRSIWHLMQTFRFSHSILLIFFRNFVELPSKNQPLLDHFWDISRDWETAKNDNSAWEIDI